MAVVEKPGISPGVAVHYMISEHVHETHPALVLEKKESSNPKTKNLVLRTWATICCSCCELQVCRCHHDSPTAIPPNGSLQDQPHQS